MSSEQRTVEQMCRDLLTKATDDVVGVEVHDPDSLTASNLAGMATTLSEILDDHSRNKETFQDRVKPWMLECFGEEISKDVIERNHRFLEESLELVQSLGCTASEAHQLVDYVFGRDIGHPQQEIGGVMVTLAALCSAAAFNMHVCGEVELKRIWLKVEQIRAKQAAKPKHSPLPQQSDDTLTQLRRDAERLAWLHSAGSNNVDGYEWGIYRVKWVNGRAVEVWQTNSDFSDLDAAIAKATRPNHCDRHSETKLDCAECVATLPELTESQAAAMNAMGDDLVQRLWDGEKV